ncbi:MAG TPA: FkbM family methyltransferase [Gemmatimonadaceae bacterium]|nr:FkbM family methyltransferase [Gemmatimonadaceae bacterium]
MICDRLIAPFLRLPHFRGKTRIETLLRRLLWTPQRTAVFAGVRMELDLAEWTQMQLLKRNWLEPQTLELYRKLLRPGDVFADVGAHVGFHSLVARQWVGASGLVLAVEPQPYNTQKILANWRANNFTNLKLLVAAAGAQDGWVELRDQVLTDRSVLTLREGGGKNEAQSFEVPMLRLDSMFQRLGIERVKLLKLDVEGYELEVVQGLGERLGDVENLVFEFFVQAERKRSNGALIDRLTNAGYRLFTVDGRLWKPDLEIPEHNLWAALKSAQ